MASSKRLLFAVMCAIWGLTWIAIKIGVHAVPPFFFAAARLVAAGAALLLLARSRGGGRLPAGSRGRIVVAALLVNAVSYGSLFWGMQYVPSGLSAVINLSMIPLGLFSIGVIANEETFSHRKVLVLALGILGLSILFLPKLQTRSEDVALAGMIAIAGGTFAYCWGSVLSRPLLRELDAVTLASFHNLVGGFGLVVLSSLFEPISGRTMAAFLTLPVLTSWLFLVVGGSVVAFTIYLVLLRDWGPSKTGLYAFVSPVVAVLVGILIYGEPFGRYEAIGSGIMLASASLAMQKRATATKEISPPASRTSLA